MKTISDLLVDLVFKYPRIIQTLSKIKWVRLFISDFIIKGIARSTNPRPRPFSLAAPYTTWQSLTDRTFTGRHLPETEETQPLPDLNAIVELWRRKDKKEIPSNDSSLLFSFFAQWFTDSFLRTDFNDRRKNTSNHEIDLCQIYGLKEEITHRLRAKKDGLMKYQIIKGEVYPPYLFNVEQTTTDNWVFADEDMEKLHPRPALEFIFNGVPEDRLKYMFAVGLEHGNSSIGYTILNTILIREHNRICGLLKESNPTWDDERLFQTARNTMIVLLIKIVVKDYVGHIMPIEFPLEASPGMAETEDWYRSNWITLEFDLLYRWHSMVPDYFMMNNKQVKLDVIRGNTPFVTEHGVGPIITAASQQRIGRIGLHNTPDFFFDPLPVGADNRSVMTRTVEMGRQRKLRSFNDYREAFSFKRLTSFEQLTDDVELQQELKSLYNNQIDDLEWHVGIFAEKHKKHTMLGELMTRMVAYDAFTHALTNPLLSKYVSSAETFSTVGLFVIDETNSLAEIVHRNVRDSGSVVASFQTPMPVPGNYGFPAFGILYDTLDFFILSGWKKFFLKRQEKYKSSVFKINLLMKSVAILDHKGFDPLFNWDGRLKKDYGFGWAVPPQALVGNIVPSVFQTNPEHKTYKSLYVEILKNQASTFEPVFNSVFCDYSNQWLEKGQFSFTEELERFCAAFVFEWYFGQRPDVDKVRYLYSNLFAHKPLGLLKLLPWSSYNKSIPMFEQLLNFVKSSKGLEKHLEAAKKLGLNDEDAITKQLMFLTGMNNFLGLQGFSKALVGELTLRPDLRKELKEEMQNAQDSTMAPLNLSALSNLPKLDNTLKEVMRLHPPVFFIYGRAEKDFDLAAKTGTYAISEGDHLMGVIPLAHLDPDTYPEPESFNPDRFKTPASTDHLIWPHGGHDATVSNSGHICPGKNVAIEFGRLLTQSLLTGFDWQLKSTPKWSDTKFTLNVASPQGSMKTSKFLRTNVPLS